MLQRFAHMSPAESQLWSAWLSKYGNGWDTYQYDVHVGEGISVGPAYDIMTQGLARSLTQKRIDVVAVRQGVIWIFEVKVQAALSALGQIVGYIDLYRHTYSYQGGIEGAIVTDIVLPDDRRVYDSYGVHLFLLPGVLV